MTKFDLRFPDGRYARSDWTSASDIGGVFEGGELRLGDYREVESAYVSLAIDGFQACGLKKVNICDREVYHSYRVGMPPKLLAETQAF